MYAVVLAGGKGTRMDPAGKSEVPKPMRPLLGHPIIEWQLAILQRDPRITDIIMSLGHQAEVVSSHFGEGYNREYGFNFYYHIDSREGLETAGALREAIENKVPKDEKNIFVLFGDIFTDLNPGELINTHERLKQAITNSFVAQRANIGVLETKRIRADSEFGDLRKVVRYKGKIWQEGNAGLCVISRDIANNRWLIDGEDFPDDLEKRFLAEGRELVGIMHTPGFWTNVSDPGDLHMTEFRLKEGLPNYPPRGYSASSPERK